MPETEADAEPDTGDSHSGGKIGDVYEVASALKGCKIIGSMWVCKVKPDGLFSILCTRFFSGSRNRLWKYIRSSLSHPRYPHCVGIAARQDCNVIQLDVQTAFLQSEMKEEVYVKQPVGFAKLDLNGQPYVCKLKKSLYGLCLLYTSPSPRDLSTSRMPSSA